MLFFVFSLKNVFNINNNNVFCAPNQIRMISEGSCDTEDE